MDIEATFNKDKYPVSILMTGTAEGETFKMKMEWSYDKNVTKTSSSIDFGGSWMLMSESKTEIVDAGNPMISKIIRKCISPLRQAGNIQERHMTISMEQPLSLL